MVMKKNPGEGKQSGLHLNLINSWFGTIQLLAQHLFPGGGLQNKAGRWGESRAEWAKQGKEIAAAL